MNYETAKKLKDNGFPQEGMLMDKFGGGPMGFPITKEIAEKLEYVCIPDLEKLIKECKKSKELKNIESIRKDNGEWINIFTLEDNKILSCSDENLEETTANLWITLYGKRKS